MSTRPSGSRKYRSELRAVTVAGMLALLLLPSISRADAFKLGVRNDFSMGADIVVVAADLNEDGKVDLVASDYSGNQINVRLGDGVGGYGPAVNFPTGAAPSGLVVCDFNKDGHQDVVTSNTGDNKVSLLLGDGAGGFAPKIDFATGTTPSFLATGDLNSDGFSDLVVTNSGSNSISVLMATGTATFFTPKVDYACAPASNPQGVAIGDLNDDGKPDAAVASYGTNQVSVFFGNSNGDGTLPARVEFTTDSSPFAVAIGDVNNDGRADLAVGNYWGFNVSVFPADGLPGNFGPRTDYTLGYASESVAIVDMNLDGKADLVAATNGGFVRVFQGDTLGSFVSPVDIATGSYPKTVITPDVNGDGRRDLVTANFYGGNVSQLLAPGGFAPRRDYATPGNPDAVAIGDVNGDGRPDLAITTNTPAASVQLGTGTGDFGPKTSFPTGTSPTDVAIADVSGDGRPDLVVTNGGSNTVSILLGNGLGQFGAKTDFATGVGPQSLAVGDVNADGRPDVAVANYNANTVSVLLGIGGGSFGAKTDYVTGTSPNGVAIGDVSGDGRLDLVLTNANSNTVSILLGNGSGGFGAKTDFTTGTRPISPTIADMNGDGLLDLVVGNLVDNTVSVLPGTGGGAFGARTDFATGTNPNSVVAGDVNSDGRLDLVVANTLVNTVGVMLGNGQGGFGPRIDLATGVFPADVAVADVSSDGRLDLVVASSSSVSVFLGLVPTRISLTGPPGASVNTWTPLTATVSIPSPGYGITSGTVQFFDGTTLLGTKTVNSGKAALVWVPTRPGNHVLSAVYSGNSRLYGSISSEACWCGCPFFVAPGGGGQVRTMTDVVSDQGGWLRMLFFRSPWDFRGSANPIMGYQIYRRANVAGATMSPVKSAESRPSRTAAPDGMAVLGWDYVSTVPATTDDFYDVVVPTTVDSNGSGIHRAMVFVRAATGTPGVFYDSAPDSGYSVDNLPPVPPAPFLGTYSSGATHLHWGVNDESDLWYYRVYRGNSAVFVPGPSNLIATRSDTGYVDSGPAGRYYKLSALDVNGNESGFALLTPSNTLEVPDAGPVAFALNRIQPNPLRGERLRVAFALPVAGPARLEVMDVSGRIVKQTDVGGLGAGQHEVVLDGGRRLPPGLYLVRLSQGAKTQVERVMVLK